MIAFSFRPCRNARASTTLRSTSAGDRETGIEQARAYRPDIILLDVLLPEADGFTVLAPLKGAEDTRAISVRLMTGVAELAGRTLTAAVIRRRGREETELQP